MTQTYTAAIKQSGPWWIGWIEEIPGVNCQERTKEELLETLRITLREALEFNRREALEPAATSSSKHPSHHEAPGASTASETVRVRAAAGRRSAFVVAQSASRQALRGPEAQRVDDRLARQICKDLGIPRAR